MARSEKKTLFMSARRYGLQVIRSHAAMHGSARVKSIDIRALTATLLLLSLNRRSETARAKPRPPHIGEES